MEQKQTAVDWLVEQMINRNFFARDTELSYTTLDHLQYEAKEMEKQQIIKAFDKGADIGNDIGSNYDYHEGNNQGYQYYNEEYGK